MKIDKKEFLAALLEGLAEIIFTLIGFGIGALIVSLFGVNFESSELDSDLLIFIGIVVILAILIAMCALVQCFKKKANNKSRDKNSIL